MWLWWLAGCLLSIHLAIAFILMGSVMNFSDAKSNADILQELLVSFITGLIWPIIALMAIGAREFLMSFAKAIDKSERENSNKDYDYYN